MDENPSVAMSFHNLQGVSAVEAFYELLSQASLSISDPNTNKPIAPVELCPILKTLYKVLIKRYHHRAFLHFSV